MKLTVKNIVVMGLAIAITIVMTTAFSVPAIVHNGYINLGDASIMLIGMLFGPTAGFIVGGIGSALSDILLSYPHYAIMSFIIKGLEGAICGFLIKTKLKKYPIIISLLAGIFMVFGYFIGEIFLYGVMGSLSSIPGNLVQGVVGAILASAIYAGIKKIVLKRGEEKITPFDEY